MKALELNPLHIYQPEGDFKHKAFFHIPDDRTFRKEW